VSPELRQRLVIGGLALAFESGQAAPLDLLRAAASLHPGFTPSDENPDALTVHLRGASTLSYRALSRTAAAAELSLDEAVIGGHLSAICRAAMSQALGNEDGALVHAAAAVVDGRAILLVAPSEGGKTTISGLLARTGIPILSDETIALRIASDRDGIDAYGTFFWSGPVLPTLQGAWPVHAIAFLEKGPLGARALSAGSALARLLREWHVAPDDAAVTQTLAIATKLLERVPASALSFELSSSPRDVASLLVSGARA
jgi:hypothetical protein